MDLASPPPAGIEGVAASPSSALHAFEALPSELLALCWCVATSRRTEINRRSRNLSGSGAWMPRDALILGSQQPINSLKSYTLQG
jgi:hypothetical protein